MIEFKLKGNDYKLPTNWNEITLKGYINLSSIFESKDDYKIPELFLLKVIEALCNAENGELDSMKLSFINETIAENLVYLQNEPEWPNTKVIKIGDIDYVFPPDLNELSIGEVVSINTLRDNVADNKEIIPYILSILLRPGHLEKDVETGKDIWVQEEFDAKNIEYRKELFKDVPAIDVMGPVSFFLSGNV